jgi:hypothetical protein
MFKTKDVPALVQAVKFAVDGDDVIATMTFYMTPIKHDLAHEIHPDVADALFKKRAGDYSPRKAVPTMNMDIEIAAQSMSYAVHRDVKEGRGLIPHVKIDKLRAMRLFANSDDFTLAFNCQFQVNDQQLMWATLNRLKKPLLLTFKKLQADLEFPAQQQMCEICNQPATHRTQPGKSLVCDEHVGAYVGEAVEKLDPEDEEATDADRVRKTIEAGKEPPAEGEPKPGRKKRAAKKAAAEPAAKKKAARKKK